MAGFLHIARAQLRVYGVETPVPELLRQPSEQGVRSKADSERLAQVLRARQRSSLDVLLSKLSSTGARVAPESDSETDSETSVSEPTSTHSYVKAPRRPWDLARAAHVCCPSLGWMRRADLHTLKADVLAGVTVCATLIPQSLSFAKLAGLPFRIGLYSACVPAFVYAMFGQSHQLAVGPVAITSLILRAGLAGKLDEAHCPSWYEDSSHLTEVYQNELCTHQYCIMMFSVAGLVGVIMLVACIFRLGFLVSFLGHPVISGVSTGAAIIIGLSQWKYFLGFPLPSTEHVHELLGAVSRGIAGSRPMPLVLGLTWLGFLVGTRRLAVIDRRYRILALAAPLLSCAMGALLVWTLPVLREHYGVACVGPIFAGIPRLSAQDLYMTWELFDKIITTAVSVALIGYMESIAVAKALASQHQYEIGDGQELLALGLSNLVGAVFSCYPVTGSFSLTAVSNASGCQTPVAGITTAVSMVIVLLFLTPAIEYLPMFALAAISTNSVMPLIGFDVAVDLWRVKRWDFYLWFVAFLGTLFIDAIKGVGIAIAMSIGVVIYESIRPQLRILWRVPGTKLYRSIDQEMEGQFVPNVLIVQLSSSLYFANVGYVKDVLLRCIGEVSKAEKVEHLILELASVLTVDATAAHLIQDIVGDCRGQGIETAFAMVGIRAMKTFTKAGLVKFVGRDMFFPTVDEAVQWCRAEQGGELRSQSTVAAEPKPNLPFETLEVGISNDLHPHCTQVCVSVPHSLEGLAEAIGAVLLSAGCCVLGARVDYTSHTYRILRGERKLGAHEIEALRARLEGLLRSLYQGIGPAPQAASAGAGRESLNRALVLERARFAEAEATRQRIDALEEALSVLAPSP